MSNICRCCEEEIIEGEPCSCGLDLCSGKCWDITDLYYFEFFDRQNISPNREIQKTYQRIPMRSNPKTYFHAYIFKGRDFEITECSLAPEWMQKQ